MNIFDSQPIFYERFCSNLLHSLKVVVNRINISHSSSVSQGNEKQLKDFTKKVQITNLKMSSYKLHIIQIYQYKIEPYKCKLTNSMNIVPTQPNIFGSESDQIMGITRPPSTNPPYPKAGKLYAVVVQLIASQHKGLL